VRWVRTQMVIGRTGDQLLTNEAGETTRYIPGTPGRQTLVLGFPPLTRTTDEHGHAAVWAHSHLSGIFYRTARMLEAGMKPVFVFDGKPPDMKSHELAKRKEGRDAADTDLAAAKEVRNVNSSRGDVRAHWVTLRARRVTLRARWVTLRARWVTLRARWVTL
jgi:hypothetical protein